MTDDPVELPFAPRVDPERPVQGPPVPIDFVFDNHYDVLGVMRSATTDEVTDATFALLKVWDRLAKQGDAAANQRVTRLTEAKEVLAKPDKRAEYDRRADTVFLSIQDPVPARRRELVEGLEHLRSLALGPGDRDPLAESGAARPDRPDDTLDQILERSP